MHAFKRMLMSGLTQGLFVNGFVIYLVKQSGPGHPRYCGVDGMNAVPKWLAKDLKVHSSERVNCLTRNVDHWVAQTESGESFCAQHLIVTTPLPQALLLLETAGIDWANGDLRKAEMRHELGLATMVILDGPSNVPEPGGMKLSGGHLSWIADNRMKGISPDVTALSHCMQRETLPARIGMLLTKNAGRAIGAAELWLGSRVVDYTCHRWGFTLPIINPWPQRYFQNDCLNLVLAGDAFGGPRVEGAALSGIESATAIGQLV